ncbi:MAG: hypothetical protein KJO70_09960 [Gammaproteobacteria bacterium]|nr:hypothetical protein [Gammaproteobacteria bacterium]
MRKEKLSGHLIALTLVLPSLAAAQTSGAVHPLIEKDFFVGAGVFFPDKNFTLSVDGSVPNEDIEFDEVFKVDDNEATTAAELRWRFGEKWSVQAQYWRVSDGGASSLEEDVEWEDVVFEKGSNVAAGVELDVARLFFGRRFIANDNQEFGLGLGVHWLEVSAFMQGEIFTSVGDSEFYRGAVKADAPLPNIGGWYTYAWSPRWAFVSRLDWLSASIGDYSGGLWNVQAGVNWAVSDHIGIFGAWNYFGLDIDVDKSDWRGSVDIAQNGPYLGLTVSW